MSIHAKKSLGQHFLRSDEVVVQIITASEIGSEDVVVEVGPGEGVLTDALLRAGARVIAIEKDARCLPVLTKRFAGEIKNGQFILIAGDILEKNITTKLFDDALQDVVTYKVVANIPYYITGMLFRYFLEDHRQPTLLTFLIQKEVAEQIVSKNKKESILSLSIKIFGDPLFVANVGKGNFDPAPKVDSAILVVKNIHHNRLQGLTHEEFFRIIKIGFRARRKMLLGNLAEGLDKHKEDIAPLFAALGIDEKARGEDISVETWVALATALSAKFTQK